MNQSKMISKLVQVYLVISCLWSINEAWKMPRRSFLSMQFKVSTISKRQGLVGTEGEIYFDPQLKYRYVDSKPTTLGKAGNMGVLLTSGILLPGCTETYNVYEFSGRALVNELKGNYIAINHMSSSIQRPSLVGTIGRIKAKRHSSDGRVTLLLEGVAKYHINRPVEMSPYPIYNIRIFEDYSSSDNDEETLDNLQFLIFKEMKMNLKLIKIAFPDKYMIFNDLVLKNLPLSFNQASLLSPSSSSSSSPIAASPIDQDEKADNEELYNSNLPLPSAFSAVQVAHDDDNQQEEELQEREQDEIEPVRFFTSMPAQKLLRKRSYFSYGIMSMLMISPAVKLSLLQTANIEERFAKLLTLIRRSSEYLRQEIIKKGYMTESNVKSFYEEEMRKMGEDPSSSKQLLDGVLMPLTNENTSYENFIDGKWVQMPIMM